MMFLFLEAAEASLDATQIKSKFCSYCADQSDSNAKDLCTALSNAGVTSDKDGKALSCTACTTGQRTGARQGITTPLCLTSLYVGSSSTVLSDLLNTITIGDCSSCPSTPSTVTTSATPDEVLRLLSNLYTLKAGWLGGSRSLPSLQALIKGNAVEFPPTAITYILSDEGLKDKTWFAAIRASLGLGDRSVAQHVQWLDAVLSPFDATTTPKKADILARFKQFIPNTSPAKGLHAKTQQAFIKHDPTMTYCSAGWVGGASGRCMLAQQGFFSYPSIKENDYISVKCPTGTTSEIGAKSLFDCGPLPIGSVFAVAKGALEPSKGFTTVTDPKSAWAVTGRCVEESPDQCNPYSVCKDTYCFQCPGAGGSTGGINVDGKDIDGKNAPTGAIIQANPAHTDCILA